MPTHSKATAALTAPARVAQVRDPLPRGTAVLRGLLGWVVLCTGLGVAIGVAESLVQRLIVAEVPRYLVQGVLMTVLVVPAILFLRGYTWTNLRDGWGLTVATTLTTLLFPLSGLLVTVVAAGLTAVLGTTTTPMTVFPADPAATSCNSVCSVSRSSQHGGSRSRAPCSSPSPSTGRS